MRELPDEFVEAITLLEAAGNFQRMVEAIGEWPGLTSMQRAVALAIAALEFKNGAAPTPIQVSQLLSVKSEAIEKAFEGQEHPPYHMTRVDGVAGWAFLPSQRMTYGDAG